MRENREILLALIAVLLISGLYLGVIARAGVPESRGLIGHGLGVIGFVMMLATETLYSFRKRSGRARWGRMKNWLQFHIFTGIVGPTLVLLHTAWQFRGLAGVVTLMTAVVVLSGFIGRYIYTTVPRTSDGMVVAMDRLQHELEAAEGELRRRFPAAAQKFIKASEISRRGAGLVFMRTVIRWQVRAAWRKLLRDSDPGTRSALAEVESVFQRRLELAIQIESMATARRLLAVWHSVHIPLGMALFVAAFVHIGAALYYATLLR